MTQLRNLDRYDLYRKIWQGVLRTFEVAIALGFLALVIGGAGFAIMVWLELRQAPDLAYLNQYQPSETVEIYDRHDKLITSAGNYKLKSVPLSAISTNLKNAVLAAEDRHFYEHQGINPGSILRACFANLHAGRVVEGGSTITQQLVKNLAFEGQKRTIQLKVAEAILAWDLERRFGKDKIFEIYLNEIYFGNGAYGIEEAARVYFNKSPAYLNVGESAFLAGIICSPSRMGQAANRALALARQQEVLQKMEDCGFINTLDIRLTMRRGLKFQRGRISRSSCSLTKYPYFVSYVLSLVGDHLDRGEIRRHGVKVFTSLEPRAQENAEAAIKQGIKNAPAGVTEGALVSVSVTDGSVMALVGGAGEYLKNQWNCATSPHTVGSAFKPFVYLAAFNSGLMSPESSIDDSPLIIRGVGQKPYAPKNFDGKFMGLITVREALMLSRNVCAVRAAQDIGIPVIIETARLAGITERLDNNLSLALGSSAVSPLQMAGAYATLARGGVAIRPWVLRRIENARGRVLHSYDHAIARTFEVGPVSQVVDVLHDVVSDGTGTQAQLAHCSVAGKTGTSDHCRDMWFVGFTPDMVTAVWAGTETGAKLDNSHLTGGTVAARLWHDYNAAYYGPIAVASHPAPIKIMPRPSIARRRPQPKPSAMLTSSAPRHVAPLLIKQSAKLDQAQTDSLPAAGRARPF